MEAATGPATSNKTSTGKSKYRPEIDGLRTFAVVAVIINHFNKDLLPSGYLGVDIFFVISGYVITSSLADRQSKNFLDFVTGFYERRIKRLLPALVAFSLITSVLITLFNPNPAPTVGMGWRALFGISNIQFYNEATDYFAESAELNPFMHTWSLGVEEQFYLLFPFLIWFSGFGQQKVKGARNLMVWVGALTIASLISFICLYQVNQPAAYFLMPPRFWELAAGCLIFIGFQKRKKIEQTFEHVPPLLVVAAMVGVLFLPTDAAVPATISIVVLSAVLIASLKKGTAAYDFFTLEKIVYGGLISYSLYLWHWSVLCISRWTIGIHWWSVPIQVGVMVLMAMASYRLIEIPCRKRVWLPEKWKTLSLGIGTALLTTTTLVGFARSPIGKVIYLGSPIDSASEWRRMDDDNSKCQSLEKGCLQKASHGQATQLFFWIGDSHTAHILPMAKMLSEKEKVEFVAYQSGGEAFQPFPTIDLIRKGVPAYKYKKERKSINTAYQQILPSLKKGDVIVLSLNLPRYFAGGSNDRQHEFSFFADKQIQTDAQTAFSVWLKKLIDMANGARTKGINVIVLLPTPHFPEYLGISVCTDQPFRPFEMQGCKIVKDEAGINREWVHIVNGLRRAATASPNLFLFDPRSAFCDGDGKCRNHSGNEMLFIDGDHLRKEGAIQLYPVFAKFLRSNNLLE